MPYLEGRKNMEETSGWTKEKTLGESKWPTGLSKSKQDRRSAVERSRGEGHGGVRPRRVATRQERWRRWGNSG